MQPEPAFYAMRNLATAMDGLRAKPFAVKVVPETKGLLAYTFADKAGKRAAVLWRDTGAEPSDGYVIRAFRLGDSPTVIREF